MTGWYRCSRWLVHNRTNLEEVNGRPLRPSREEKRTEDSDVETDEPDHASDGKYQLLLVSASKTWYRIENLRKAHL